VQVKVVERVFWEGYLGFPAGMVVATTVTRTRGPWRWRGPDSSGIVGPAVIGIDKDFICIIDLSKLFLCRRFLFRGDTVRVGL